MSKVVVIGGGAAGMFASIAAAGCGHQVVVYEKNEKLGKKLYITGKGRCNITNACDMEGLFDAVRTNAKFLYSSFYGYTNQQGIDFFERIGVPTKIERGDRVFPVSDHSSDVIRALERLLQREGVKVHLHSSVKRVLEEDGQAVGLELSDGKRIQADSVIVATGGLSYPSTGSTGDGYRWAEATGHKVVACTPSLVPFVTEDTWCAKLQGLALKNVNLALYFDGKEIYQGFGEMLFTHFGVSGPIVLSLSNLAADALAAGKDVELEVDLKPALSEEKLDARIQRDFVQYSRKQVLNGMKDLLPQRLIPVVLDMSYVDENKFINQVSREERHRLLQTLKHFVITISATRPIAEAIVTAGGVSVKEIDPKTMESKRIKGLYFAGEVMDVDGYTGGYNLQAAFSSGHAAGEAAATEE